LLGQLSDKCSRTRRLHVDIGDDIIIFELHPSLSLFEHFAGTQHSEGFPLSHQASRCIEDIPSAMPPPSSSDKSKTHKLALKGSAKSVVEFFDFACNTILFQRGVYPPEDFTT